MSKLAGISIIPEYFAQTDFKPIIDNLGSAIIRIRIESINSLVEKGLDAVQPMMVRFRELEWNNI